MTAPLQHISATTHADGDCHINVTSFSDIHVRRKEPLPSLLRKAYDLWAAFEDGRPPRVERFNPCELTIGDAYRLVVEVNTVSENPFNYAILRGNRPLRQLRNMEQIGHKRWHYNTFLEVREERRPIYEEVEELGPGAETDAYYRRVLLPVVDDAGTVVRIYVVHRLIVGEPLLVREAHD